MLDLSTMTRYTTFESWVKSWPEEEKEQVRELGYDDWEGKPGSKETRLIYLAFKSSIWNYLKRFTGGDVTGYLFDEEGYLANDEAELIDVLVGGAIEAALWDEGAVEQ